ncbi:MAG TPA: septal ring lytic transglycosylase RlpA family protein [Azospirillaceae bacterium]|nr:septal ring lytic transglycosylase RlpA family protein [Azospirillaceae bacterium]
MRSIIRSTAPALTAMVLSLGLAACSSLQSAEGGASGAGGSRTAGAQAGAQAQVNGVFRQEGEASFFRAGEGGNTKTASGEPVDPQGMTAAHRTLPLGTKATVTSPETGKSVEVTINDRGPARTDRVIDISERAATELGIDKLGVAKVTVEADPAKQDSAEARQALTAMAGGGQG